MKKLFLTATFLGLGVFGFAQTTPDRREKGRTYAKNETGA